MHKTNVLTFAGDLWHRTVNEVAAEYPDVDWDYNHVDAACIYLVEQPKRYDVIVTDNLFGDILTDLAGAVSGGIGFAASANLNPARTGPSLFEPVHGAAHDIAGKGIANPLAAIHSAALMLDHLGEADAAARILKALERPVRFHVNAVNVHRQRSPPPPWATPSQKGCSRHAHHPDREDLDGRRARRLGRRHRARAHPHHALRLGRLRGHPRLPDQPRRGRVPARRPHPPALRLGQDLHDRRAVHASTRSSRPTRQVVRVNGLDDGCYLRPLVYLGYGEMGLNPLPCPVNVSVAAWPWGTYLGDEGIANGVSVQDQLVAAPRPQRGADGGQGHRHVRQLLAGQGGGAQGRLRRGHPARPQRQRQRVHRARTSSSCATACSSRRRPPTPARWTASPRTRSRPSPATSATRCATSRIIRTDLYLADEAFLTGTAAEVVPIRAVDDRPVGPGSPGRITKEIQQTYFATVRGEVDQYKDWLDHVD